MREAIILAGGFGTRLQHIVPNFPKPMVPIAGRPFLTYVLDSLASKGFSRVILSLGFMAEKIQVFFGNQYQGMELVYVVEKKPLGTGGAVRLAMSNSYADHVFVFNGDTYLDLEVDGLEQFWQKNNNPVIVGRQVPDTFRYGRLITDNSRVTGFSEKGVSGAGMINAGCYVFNQDQLNQFTVNSTFSLESDYLEHAVKLVDIDLFVTRGYFIDIGIPEDYELAQVEMAGF